jgi:hypothetical protein
MNIIDALKKEDLVPHVRLSCGDRWMVWNDGEWTVCGRCRHTRITKVLTTTENEEAAVGILVKGG